MTSARNKPGVAFWATVVVVCLPLLYTLSFGPACWITSSTAVRTRTTGKLYYPVLAVAFRSSATSQLVRSYSTLFTDPRREWDWFRLRDGSFVWECNDGY